MLIPIFDLDGTLLDSDAALTAAFVRCGVPADQVTFGHVVADECARLGIAMADFLAAYDPGACGPFPGVDELLAGLDRWGICSNKDGPSARAELVRLGWRPSAAAFADRFTGHKDLRPVLEMLGTSPDEVVFVGDTDHDRRCAAEVGCRFVLAGWNRRATAAPGDVVATGPGDLLRLLSLT